MVMFYQANIPNHPIKFKLKNMKRKERKEKERYEFERLDFDSVISRSLKRGQIQRKVHTEREIKSAREPRARPRLSLREPRPVSASSRASTEELTFLEFISSLKSSSAGKMTSNLSNFASKTPTKQIEQEYLTNTQKFYDEYFNRSSDNDLDNQSNKSLSTHGALELSKNYHESVDELLKLCDEVTEAAGNSIEEQGVSKNESCDPVGEDMFKVPGRKY